MLVIGGCVLALFLWVKVEQRQYALNRDLIEASKKSEITKAITLIEAGADPNTHVEPTPPPSLFQIVDQLLHREPAPSNESPTAFMVTCGGAWGDGDRGYQSMNVDPSDQEQLTHLARLMIAHRANVNTTRDHGSSALLEAVYAQRGDLVKLLLMNHADPNQTRWSGASPLMAAARTGQTDLVNLLLDFHADINAKDNLGDSPLILAVTNNHPTTVAALLQHHADVRGTLRSTGFTVDQIITMLRHAGANE